ncbi:MAG: hypothetical protein RR386_02995 [Bacteroidaceae bacterium]
MKKELTLGRSLYAESSAKFNVCPLFARLQQLVLRFTPLVALAGIYSKVMEQRITPLQTLQLLHAQIACFALILVGSTSWLLSILFLVWAVVAVWQCKRALD